MSNNKPTHRILFSRITGKDQNGKDKLGFPMEIGAIFPQEGKEGGIVKWHHMPIELTKHEGVTFMRPVRDNGPHTY